MPKFAEKFFGERRLADFSTHKIPETITCPSVFLFGASDRLVGIDEAKRLAKKYKGIFEVVPNAHHELTNEYLKKQLHIYINKKTYRYYQRKVLF